MYRGKHLARKRHNSNKKTSILLASLVLILGISVSTTVAYLLDNTNSVTNTFTPANVTVEVKESFQNNVKSDVYIHNTSDIKVYVRATIVEYWKKGNDIVAKPAEANVTIDWGDATDWVEIDDVYYYKTALDPNKNDPNSRGSDDTKNLIDKVTVTIPEGYTYHMDIYSEAIQAEPADAIKTAWKINPETWTKITDGGT